MIVDSCVLLDILLEQRDGPASARALNHLQQQGTLLLINPIIYAEIGVFFQRRGHKQCHLDDFVKLTGLAYRDIGREIWWAAAALAANKSRARRERILPDYAIAAHAIAAGGLLTRDDGFRIFMKQGLHLVHPLTLIVALDCSRETAVV